jgi:hypothetical protein
MNIIEEAKKHPEFWIAEMYMELSDKLMELCLNNNISIEDLSKKSGVSLKKIKKFIKCEKVKLDDLYSLFHVFNYTIKFKVEVAQKKENHILNLENPKAVRTLK